LNHLIETHFSGHNTTRKGIAKNYSMNFGRRANYYHENAYSA